MTRSFLSLLLPVALLTGSLHAADPRVKVALYDDSGSGGKGIPAVQSILNIPGVNLDTLSAEQIRTGSLKDYDVVIFTGGSGSKQAEALQDGGVQEVRKFVEGGGGYLGICAGAYLACEGFSWSAKILNAKTVSQKWRRGHGDVDIELTEEGKKVFGDLSGVMPVRYANGPIIKAGDEADMPAFQPLAYFRTEVAENDTPVGAMVNSPAIVFSTFGKGKLITMSPHPEQTDALNDMITKAVKWVARPAGAKIGAN